MTITIITGMAGAGKSTVLDSFEDLGYYCIDNLPPDLLKDFISLFQRQPDAMENLAVVMDLRLGSFFGRVLSTIDELRNAGHQLNILFVDAGNETLLKRFKETRRLHPLESRGNRAAAIRLEREKLKAIRDRADIIIDTSHFNAHQLKKEIQDQFGKLGAEAFQVLISSFGMKYGELEQADYVFDLRFLPNPFYEENLRELSGYDSLVRDYIMDHEVSQKTLEKIEDFLLFALTHIRESGRASVHIGFGCTGGKHRSVTFALLVGEFLEQQGFQVMNLDRDANKHG